jgi:hypothetical protein
MSLRNFPTNYSHSHYDPTCLLDKTSTHKTFFIEKVGLPSTHISSKPTMMSAFALFLLWGLIACRHCESLLTGQQGNIDEEGQYDDSLSLSSSSLHSVPLFCIETSRCKTLHMDRNFSFVHISKTGGASWVAELQSLLPKGNVYPQAPQEQNTLYHFKIR